MSLLLLVTTGTFAGYWVCLGPAWNLLRQPDPVGHLRQAFLPFLCYPLLSEYQNIEKNFSICILPSLLSKGLKVKYVESGPESNSSVDLILYSDELLSSTS